jgi:hypothetical protein
LEASGLDGDIGLDADAECDCEPAEPVGEIGGLGEPGFDRPALPGEVQPDEVFCACPLSSGETGMSMLSGTRPDILTRLRARLRAVCAAVRAAVAGSSSLFTPA